MIYILTLELSLNWNLDLDTELLEHRQDPSLKLFGVFALKPLENWRAEAGRTCGTSWMNRIPQQNIWSTVSAHLSAPGPPSVDSCFLRVDWPAIWGTGSGLLEVEQVDEVLEAKAHLEETQNQLLLTEHHHLHTEAPPPLTCWAVLFPSWAETRRNVFRLAPLCWQAVRMARSASLKQEVLGCQSDCRNPFKLIKYWLLITVWYTATCCYFTPLTFSNKLINNPDTVCLGSDRVQTTTFSPLDVTEMFLAQTARPDSSPSSLSHPASLSSLFLFPWGGFWDM